ncbi:polyketide cyclase/dehydrase/lipid transport superfamily protein [Thalictrum thalictroides]|uniref:Polyketide cyclase/dehydrase/lipid transport superfamily protein n=1 Tax=Thalictrum thalictroides TaxID=46969 RepID=A0A7J6WT36_THATH|nr:polyketide cyclase/dehydrase/lipid transport superfamily protein [Thalictrum thalictroides]
MEKKQKIFDYRDRLDKTLASHDLVDEQSIKNLVRNQLVHSSPSDTHGYNELLLEKRTIEVSKFLDMLRSVSKKDSEVSKTDGIPNRDWKLKQDNEDYRVMYREGLEGTPFHTLLVEGYVDGPVDVCLCLSWEAALFKKWWPQFNVPPFKIIASDCLQEVRMGEQIIQMRVKVAWPLSAREIILHYFVVEYFEGDLVIVLLNSISDTEGGDKSTHGFTKDQIPDAKDFVRIDVVGGFVLQRMTSNISYFRTVATMDIKLDLVPPSLINFVSRQLIGSGFKLYKKTIASITKGDEDFSQALKEAPLYVRVRESLYPENKFKKALQPEAIRGDESATKVPQVDTMVIEEINPSDSHATTSSQAATQFPGQTYSSEIEEVEIEQETQSEIQASYESEIQASHDNIEVKLEKETHMEKDKIIHHSPTNLTADQWSKEKSLISPKVEHALRVLDNAISMVREGYTIQNWSGFGSIKQEQLHSQKVDSEVDSVSSEERSSDDGVCLEAPEVDHMESLEEDDSSSGFFDIRHDKEDSPLQKVNHTQMTAASPKRNSANTTEKDGGYSSHNEKMMETPVLENLSRDLTEIIVKVNGVHESNENGGRSSTSTSSTEDEESAFSIRRNHHESKSHNDEYDVDVDDDDHYNANPYIQQQLYYDPERNTLGRRIIILLLSVFIVACGISTILLFNSDADPPNLDIESALVSGFELSSSPFNGAMNVTFLFVNPNSKTDIVYESIDIWVLYKEGEMLTGTTLSGFEQARNTTTKMKVEFNISTSHLQIAEDRQSGFAHFIFEFYFDLYYITGKQQPRKSSTEATCDNVIMNFKSEVGTLPKDHQNCHVGSGKRSKRSESTK